MDIPEIPGTQEVLNQASQTVSNTKNFIFENVVIIFALSLCLMVLFIIATIFDVSLKENDTITSDIYILEGNRNIDEQRRKKCTSDVNEVQTLCNDKGSGELGKERCMKYECCIWPEYKNASTDRPKCIAGSKTGPSVSTSNLGFDEFYYMNKKYNI